MFSAQSPWTSTAPSSATRPTACTSLRQALHCTGATPDAILRGLQTLRQLIDAASDTTAPSDPPVLPCVEIDDRPAFAWLASPVMRCLSSDEVELPWAEAFCVTRSFHGAVFVKGCPGASQEAGCVLRVFTCDLVILCWWTGPDWATRAASLETPVPNLQKNA